MIQEQLLQRSLRGDEAMIPHQDPKNHRRVKLNTLVY
jgi:hypothetical protein